MQPLMGFAEPVSSWLHLLTALAAFVGGYKLIKRARGNGLRLTSLIIYTFSLVFLFSMSGVYHLLEKGGIPRMVFQRLDHAGIWMLIVGTLTPIHVILFRGAWRWSVLLVAWTLAISGLVIEVIFFNSIPEWLSLSFYLGMGLFGLLAVWHFKRVFKTEQCLFLILGGVFYALGALMEYFNWPLLWPEVFGPHELFHILVIIATICNWCFIYYWADHPVWSTMVFDVKIFSNQKYQAQAIGEHIKVEADSLEKLKTIIREQVNARFYRTLPPKTHLKFSQEKLL